MTSLKQCSRIFNQAFQYLFNPTKFLSVFIILLFSGLVFLFFQAIAMQAPNWLKLPLLTVPFFLLCFLLMLSGIELSQAYLKEKEGETVKKPFFFSRPHCRQVCYLYFPLLLASIACAVMLGILILIKSIPFLGSFLGIILAFVPFLLNLCLLILCLAALLALFFLTPVFAAKNEIDRKTLLSRFRSDLFSHILFIVLAVFPIWFVWKLASHAAALTLWGYAAGDSAIIKVLQGFFILLPFAAILTYPVIFFFNLSQEVYTKSFQGNVSDL